MIWCMIHFDRLNNKLVAAIQREPKCPFHKSCPLQLCNLPQENMAITLNDFLLIVDMYS